MGRARSRAAAAALGVVSLVCAGRAEAQLPDTPYPPPVHTLPVDPTRLVPGDFTYETIVEQNTNATALGTRTVHVARTRHIGVDGWLLLETRAGRAAGADSLFVDLAFHPLHWGSSIGRARLSLEFRADSVYGGTTAPAGARSIIAAVPIGTLINGVMLESLLRLLPFHAAWEDSASMVSVTLANLATVPMRIAVVGEDSVHVPAGTFACWVVSVRAGDASRGMYWVTKENPIVVRSALDVPSSDGTTGAQYVSSLTFAVGPGFLYQRDTMAGADSVARSDTLVRPDSFQLRLDSLRDIMRLPPLVRPDTGIKPRVPPTTPPASTPPSVPPGAPPRVPPSIPPRIPPE